MPSISGCNDKYHGKGIRHTLQFLFLLVFLLAVFPQLFSKTSESVARVLATSLIG